MADTTVFTTDLGAVTAYADAVDHGYTGTRDEFGVLLAGAGKNLEDAVDAKNAAANSAAAASDSAGAAAKSATAAGNSASAALGSATAASGSATAAGKSAEGAAGSATAAQSSAEAAQNSAAAAKNSETAAAKSAADAREIKDSMPADYTTMSGDVDTLKNQMQRAYPDDSTIGENPWSSKHIVDMLCPPLQESGNPVQCYPVENYPLGVKVSWEPTQSGEGDPSPDNIRPITGRDAVQVTRCGKNLFSAKNAIDVSTTGIENVTIEDNRIILSSNFNLSWMAYRGTFDIPAGIYTVTLQATCSDEAYVPVLSIFSKNKYTGEKGYLGEIRGTGGYTIEVADYLLVWFYAHLSSDTPYTGVRTVEYSNIQIAPGSTPTPYEPYTGSTTDIALPETVYGGEVDAVSGEGQETWKTMTLDGTEEWKQVRNYCETAFMDLGIPSSGNNIEAAKLSQRSDRYIIDNPFANTSADKCAWVYSSAMYSYANLRIKHEAEQSTLENWKAYLAAQYAAGTPVQVCYKLAEPVPFTATGTQPIPAMSGVNTLYTDADGVVVTGAEDPKHTITELKNAIISLGGNV